MGEYHEPGISIVSWRIAASTVHLCERCRASYGSALLCDACLQQANADLSAKRDIFFPEAGSGADQLSTVAVGGPNRHAQSNEKTSIARSLLRVLTWDVGH